MLSLDAKLRCVKIAKFRVEMSACTCKACTSQTWGIGKEGELMLIVGEGSIALVQAKCTAHRSCSLGLTCDSRNTDHCSWSRSASVLALGHACISAQSLIRSSRRREHSIAMHQI